PGAGTGLAAVPHAARAGAAHGGREPGGCRGPGPERRAAARRRGDRGFGTDGRGGRVPDAGGVQRVLLQHGQRARLGLRRAGGVRVVAAGARAGRCAAVRLLRRVAVAPATGRLGAVRAAGAVPVLPDAALRDGDRRAAGGGAARQLSAGTDEAVSQGPALRRLMASTFRRVAASLGREFVRAPTCNRRCVRGADSVTPDRPLEPCALRRRAAHPRDLPRCPGTRVCCDLSGKQPRMAGEPRHIRLTSHPGQGTSGAPVIHWGAADALERGPVIGTTANRSQRNVIGTHSGSYGVYRALAVAAGALVKGHRPDLTNTAPTDPVGPYPAWGDPTKIVSMDPWGAVVSDVFREWIAQGYDIRPTIAVTKAHIDMPEVKHAISAGRLKADNRILLANGSAVVTKSAIEPVWWLPGVAKRFGVAESELRR